ncbi:MAG: hypothetical protein ABIO44_06775 [Saprospiraceae bacterium]
MNTKVKLGIVIGLYMLIMLAIGANWMHMIYVQDHIHLNKLIVKIFKPSTENMLIQEKDIARCVREFYKRDWKKIPIQGLNSALLESTLERMHVIHHAEVYVDAMENLHVDVYQRDPLFRVMESTGDQFYVDSEGKKIPASMNYSARVPVVTGILQAWSGEDVWNKANTSYKIAFNVMKEIVKDPFINSLVEQVDMDSNGELTFIPKIGFEKIQFGKAELILEKLEKLKFFYKEGLRYEGWNVYQTLNLKVKDQVIGVKNLNKS